MVIMYTSSENYRVQNTILKITVKMSYTVYVQQCLEALYSYMYVLGTREGDTRGERECVPLARPILSSALKLLSSVYYAGEYASLSDIQQLTISRVKGPHKSWRHVITHARVSRQPLLSYEFLFS